MRAEPCPAASGVNDEKSFFPMSYELSAKLSNIDYSIMA
jgi:hypothetical protein